MGDWVVGCCWVVRLACEEITGKGKIKGRREKPPPHPSTEALRPGPVDVRLCLFIESDAPPAAAAAADAAPPRAVTVEPEPILVVDDRGLLAASLGRAGAPLREAFGRPDARFRFFITSVFNDNGLTTPCNL